MQPYEGQVVCYDCDDTGLNCDYKDKVEVMRKYWRPAGQDLNQSLQLTNPIPERSQPIQAVLCPWPDACVGGNTSGNVSCAPGHTGLMCGFCETGFYRGSSICVACPGTLGTFGQAVSAAWVASLMFFLFGISVFLKLGAKKDSPAGGPQKPGLAAKFPRFARYMARMPPRWRQQMAAIGKIVLAFTQCLAPLTQFTMVRWPKTFTTFIERLDIGQQTADAVRLDSVIPAECMFGRRLGFYYEMLATCLLPLVSFLLILLVAFVVYAIEHSNSKKEYTVAKQKHDRLVAKNLLATSEDHPPPKPPISMKEKLNRPQVWTLNIWAWMVLFPVVTRKMVKMMPGQCREICSNDGDCLRYLKDDPGIVCYEGMYWVGLVVAVVVLLFWCIAWPYAIFRVTSAFHHSGSKMNQERVALFTESYDERFHYWEAIEQLRKFLLTSLVLVVFPDTLVQLWYIDVVGLIFLILYLGAAPYRDSWPSKVQVASLVQLEFTYITATLFFERDPDDSVGVALVVSNCVVAMLLVVAVGRGVGEISTQLGELGLTFADDGTMVTLPPPNPDHGLDTHLYVSHTWKHAQEQCAVIRSLLFTMLPSCTIRLADDNVTGPDGKKMLEENVSRSTVVLIFLTIEYIGSPQCLLELRTVYEKRKPLIIVREADPNYGGLSAAGFRAEVNLFLARKGSWLSAEEHAAVQWLLRGHAQGALEWHREKQYKYAVLKHVAEGLYHHTSLTPSGGPKTEDDGADAVPGGAQASGPRPSKPSLADSSEQAEEEAPPAAAEPAGKRRVSLFSPRVLKDKGAATCSSIAAEAEQETAEQQPLKPATLAVRKMRIQDAISLPEADIDNMVIYLSAHYKKLPATGFSTGRQAEAAADPSEYHTLKEGGDASSAPATLYDEVVSRFEECGIKVTSDGEAAYAADKRAIVLIVLSPELFKCAELVDEIAKHLDRQAPSDPKDKAAAKDAHMKKALLGGGAGEAHSTTHEDLLSVDDVPLEMKMDADTKLEAFEVGAPVVFGMRSARPGPSAETHSTSLVKTPLGFGMVLDERNKVIGVSPDSQASRGGVRLGDVIVALDGDPCTGLASSAFGAYSVGTSVTFGLRSAPAAFAEAPALSEDAGHTFSVTLTKTARGFGLGLSAHNSVTTIAPGSQAAKDGRITVGDTLVSLNGTALSTVEPEPLTTSQSFNPVALLRAKKSFVKQKSKQSVAMSFGMSNAVRNRVNRSGSGLRWMRRQKTLIPLYSTACTYDEYVRTCPPDLKELGIFLLPFEKWPETASLQPVAAALALAKLGRERSAQEARGVMGIVRRIGHGLAIGGGAVAFTTVAAFDRV